MADSRVKKVVIPKSKLPAYSGENQSYIVRYRIVSEDKNRNSHWSPQYKLPVSPQLDKTKNSLSENEYLLLKEALKKYLEKIVEISNGFLTNLAFFNLLNNTSF
jgi:hypothetical protein